MRADVSSRLIGAGNGVEMAITINGIIAQDQANSGLAGSPITPSETSALSITRLGAYMTGSGSGSGEGFAYDKVSKQLFVMNNVTKRVEIVSFADPSRMTKVAEINVGALPDNGGMNSLAIANGVLAVAIESATAGNPGQVALYSASTGALLKTVTVGVLPDMLIFTSDGRKILVANEGERAGSLDPAGSISLIDLSNGVENAGVQTTGFAALDGQESALRALGVRIAPGKSASVDLEPEYISISPDGKWAYVTLQEANSTAVFDITGLTPVLKRVAPLGYVDHALAGNESDYSDRDAVGSAAGTINLHTAPIKGLLMPDAIASFSIGGSTYFVTANEGDARSDDSDVARLSTLDLNNNVFGASEADLMSEDNAGRLNVSTIDGDFDPSTPGLEAIYTLGGRGFTVFKVNVDGSVTKVYESGGEFEKIIAAQLPTLFNNNQTNTAATFDTRSDDKGPEPEGIDVALIGGRYYAFVGLEREGGMMVYDVTNPSAAKFTRFVPSFAQEDNGPEIVKHIAAADSPTGKALVLTANEISGSVTVYEVAPKEFTLQLLHFYGESGLLAANTAPILGAMVDRFKADVPNTFIVAEGDNWIPGPWLVGGADPSLSAVPGIGSTALARPDVAIMNALGVNVSALGNHEFDLGSPVVAGAIAASGPWAGAKFPFITSNLDFSVDASLRPLADASLGGSAANAFAGKEAATIGGKIAPYAIVTMNGEKIGVVGATTYDLLSKTSPNGTTPKDDGDPATSDLQEVAAYVQASVNALTAMGVNKIIMVDQLDTIDRNKALAPLVSGIDVMVAGGGHERQGDLNDVAEPFNGHSTNFTEQYPVVATALDGSKTLIVTTDTEYSYLGRLVVTFDEAGKIKLDSLDSVINGAYASTATVLQKVYATGLSAQEIIAGSETGAKVQAITNAINNVIVAKDGLKYGFSNVYLEGDRVFGRTQEVNLGDITADANAWYAMKALGGNPLIVSLKNGGGLRASVGSIGEDGQKVANVSTPTGNISKLDVENSLRFDNKLMVFDATPAGMLKILQFMADLATQGASGSQQGGFPQIGGLRFSFDPDKPAGARLVDAAVKDAYGNEIPLVDDGYVVGSAPSVISVVTLNFTANGGDGYPIKPNASNFRYLLDDGTMSAAIDKSLDFTAAANVPVRALGEQKAFSDYLVAFHGTAANAYNTPDTPQALDTRIENLKVRADDVLSIAYEQSVNRLYDAALDRVGDTAGLKYWASNLDASNGNLLPIARDLLRSAEFTARFGNVDALNDTAFLTLTYRNALERAPDASGLSYWQGQLSAGASRESVLISFAESDESRASVVGVSSMMAEYV